MKILGLDPGLGTTGFAVLDTDELSATPGDYGVITTPKDTPTPDRLMVLDDDIRQLLETIKPDVMAIEVFIPNPRLFQNNPMVLQARGVVLLAARRAGVIIFEYKPNVIKQTVTGSGNAVKHEVQQAMADRFPDVGMIRPDDAADALACALTHHIHMGGS